MFSRVSIVSIWAIGTMAIKKGAKKFCRIKK